MLGVALALSLSAVVTTTNIAKFWQKETSLFAPAPFTCLYLPRSNTAPKSPLLAHVGAGRHDRPPRNICFTCNPSKSLLPAPNSLLPRLHDVAISALASIVSITSQWEPPCQIRSTRLDHLCLSLLHEELSLLNQNLPSFSLTHSKFSHASIVSSGFNGTSS